MPLAIYNILSVPNSIHTVAIVQTWMAVVMLHAISYSECVYTLIHGKLRDKINGLLSSLIVQEHFLYMIMQVYYV